ncbi:MAG: hypothetical protein F6K23_11420 [Okeania sp. SIO2C9]|uniref:hypothetical protein n=1 Tax=Okeania sp. SIO2C9 TaxID=2607791 RepID=UPI0013C05066|nr:hypothetical protein [Okeania sp. SIO2C9]NEQ73616.1 hypothetical protein [Okeania sp. SIO2C9]
MFELFASLLITQRMVEWYPVGANRKATTSINMNTIEYLGDNLWGAEILKQYDQEDEDGMREVYMGVQIDCNTRRFLPIVIRRITATGQVIVETTLEGNGFISPIGSEKGILTICDR